MPIPTPGKPRQADLYELGSSLVSMVRFRLARGCVVRLCLKYQEERKEEEKKEKNAIDGVSGSM